MQTDVSITPESTTDRRYGRCLENSRKIRWDIDKDVIRGRDFDYSGHFLPDGLSMISRLKFLSAADARLLSQVQGRTYANIFGLVERFINAKVLELSREHWLGDQVALEALVGFSQEELKHQELFRRLERMMAASMLPLMRTPQAAGCRTLDEIANGLNGRGVRTARGRSWHASSVRNVLLRANAVPSLL